jgi:hypothetical protein
MMLYVDPSAGSVLLQVAFAAVVGGALTVKRWWASVASFFRSGMRRVRPH